jgi:hypothetical protein
MPCGAKGTYADGLAPERGLTCGVGGISLLSGDNTSNISSATVKAMINLIGAASGGAADSPVREPARLPLLACGAGTC